MSRSVNRSTAAAVQSRVKLGLVCVLAGVLAASAAHAAPLRIVEVSAPAINCVFDGDCRITVNDSTDAISLPHASGEGFLQSRTAPPGEPGTTGEGSVPYEYRVDIRQVAGLTALPCITELAIDFGAHRPLDFDGDGRADDVFVVTGGGLGSVGLASADKVGDRITFRFEPAVCAGSARGAGESTFFFGLAGAGPPRAVTAQASGTAGTSLTLDARAPGGSGGGGGGGSGFVPCLPGLPISADVPVCRCLRDPVLRELRCGVLHPNFVLVRRTPLPIPPGPFDVSWTLVPLQGAGGKVVVEDALPPGFERLAGATSRLELRTGDGQGQALTRKHQLINARQGGSLGMTTLVTFKPGGSDPGSTTEIFLPIGPLPWPSLDDAPAEPLPLVPRDPDFGDDECARAADEAWQDHLESPAARLFGRPSLAEYEDLKDRVERCRQLMPAFAEPCARTARRAFARCHVSGGDNCRSVANRARQACLIVAEDAMDDFLGCHLPRLFRCP